MTFSSQKYSNSYTFILSNMKSMSFVKKKKKKNLSTETKLFISFKVKQLTKQSTKSTESFSEMLLNFKNVCQLR